MPPGGPNRPLKRWTLVATALLLAALPALPSCVGDQQEQEEETEQEQQQARSDFYSLEDSLRWVEFLTFSPQDTALGYLMMGVLYETNDHPEQALHYLELAAQEDPDRPVIYLNMGISYNKIGDYEQATESFRRFLQLNPGSILTEDIFHIVEKYRSRQSENERNGP